MRRTQLTEGFSAVEAILVVLIVAALGLGGWYAWHHEHKAKPAIKGSASQTNKNTSATKSSSSSSSADPYAGWQTYCDTTYYYCFKYPSDWIVTGSTTADSSGGSGGISLLSPTKTVQVIYSNDFTKDSNVVDFVAETISKLTAANQELSLIGGYMPSSGDNGLAGNNIPIYEIVDSSYLNSYPLTIGQPGQFPSNPGFQDQRPGETEYVGSLISKPAVTISTVDQSQGWLASPDAKTSIMILDSIYYNQ